MDGIFIKSKTSFFYNLIGILSGIFIVCLFGGFLFFDISARIDENLFSIFFVFFGLLIIVLCSLSVYVNQKAFIHADENGISAFCHFGLSLHCKMDEINRISYKSDTLNIELQNGKKYNLICLENAEALGRYIEKRVFREPLIPSDKKEWIEKAENLRKKCTRQGIFSLTLFIAIIPEILITAALTDWKDLYEFQTKDWYIFAAMFALGAVTIAIACFILRKFLKNTDEHHYAEDTLNRILFYTEPLKNRLPLKVFLNDPLHPYFRLTVYGFSDSEKCYYIIETRGEDHTLQCLGESDLYDDYEFLSLALSLEDMTEIPLPL